MADINIKMAKIFVKYILNTDADIVWQIGGRYSGKSYAMEQLAALKLVSKKKYKFLVIEDKEGNVNQGTKAGILARMEEMQLDKYFTPTKKPAEIVSNLNSNKALFKGYSTEEQAKQVKALNQITAIWYEEAEKIEREQVEDLFFQLRGGDPEDRKLYLTLNPVNVNCYANVNLIQQIPDKVLEYFPNSNRPKVFIKNVNTTFKYNGKEETVTLKHLVVLTTHHDNAWLELKQRAAIEALSKTDPDKYKQLAEARFIQPSGTFFKEFSRDIHVIEPFTIPKYWKRIQVIDYGLDMLAGLWIAIDTRGKAYLYRETNQPDLPISSAAKELIRLSAGEDIAIRYGPTDLWNRRQETGRSGWDIFVENNWVMQKADRNRENGCLAAKEWLKVYDTKDEQTGETIKSADFKVFNTCTKFIEHVEQILKDDKNSNVYATEPHELTHNVDAFRYFAIMRTAPTTRRFNAIKPSKNNFEKKPAINPYTVGYSEDFIKQFGGK